MRIRTLEVETCNNRITIHFSLRHFIFVSCVIVGDYGKTRLVKERWLQLVPLRISLDAMECSQSNKCWFIGSIYVCITLPNKN